MPRVGPIRLALPGMSSLAAPLRIATAVGGMAAEALGGPSRRRCSTNGERHWIEVRGINEIDDAVLWALRATPGVKNVTLNRSQLANSQADRDEATMWRAIGIRGAATTGGATLAWLLARTVPGTQRRTPTVALVGLVSTQMLQTFADSHAPLVLVTTAGSFAAMVGAVSTPGLSQLFGCTPIGPFGWGQAFFAAAAASAVSAIAPGLLARFSDRSLVLDHDDAGPYEDGVDVAEWRGQDADRAAEQRVLSQTTEEATHDFAR